MTNKIILTRSFTIVLFLFSFFVGCKQDSDHQKELWGVVINFFSPDTSYYPGTKTFPFPDSLRFEPLDVFFTNQDKRPIISDSSIIFDDNYRENGEKKCCKKDTLEVYIDSIGGKKYLFAIGEYITVFQSNNNSDTNLRSRGTVASIPLWDIRLNIPYPAEKFKDDYEKLGAKFVKLDERIDEVYKQKWSEIDSVLVETIQFRNSTDRIITAVSKDMNKNEVDSTIEYITNKFPGLKYNETIQINKDGMPLKITRIYFQGVSISIKQLSPTGYSFMVTDYYETIKLIINNAGTGYIFRDDLKIY